MREGLIEFAFKAFSMHSPSLQIHGKGRGKRNQSGNEDRVLHRFGKAAVGSAARAGSERFQVILLLLGRCGHLMSAIDRGPLYVARYIREEFPWLA